MGHGTLASELYGVILADVCCTSPSSDSKILRSCRRVAGNVLIKNKIFGTA